MDTNQEGRVIFATLGEDRQVVIEAEKDAKKDKTVRCHRSNDSRAKHGEWHHCVVALIILPDQEQHQSDAGADEQADYDKSCPKHSVDRPIPKP